MTEIHQLPQLPYDYGDLEPYLDRQTMEIHHRQHHQGYVNNLNAALNAALAGHPDLQTKTIEELLRGIDQVPEEIRQAIINHGGGHYNHSLFWQVMSPGPGGVPEGDLLLAIESKFGGFEAFQDKFSQTALTCFGSGWAWLVVDHEGKLVIESTVNQDSPLMLGHSPILGLDVWEHGYYLKYQNRRSDYIAAWWNVVNWGEVSKLFNTRLQTEKEQFPTERAS